MSLFASGEWLSGGGNLTRVSVRARRMHSLCPLRQQLRWRAYHPVLTPLAPMQHQLLEMRLTSPWPFPTIKTPATLRTETLPWPLRAITSARNDVGDCAYNDVRSLALRNEAHSFHWRPVPRPTIGLGLLGGMYGNRASGCASDFDSASDIASPQPTAGWDCFRPVESGCSCDNVASRHTCWCYSLLRLDAWMAGVIPMGLSANISRFQANKVPFLS